MGLQEYHAKRRFDRTPEPEGSCKSGSGALRFVIQKHAASRLHYDFRLEVSGTLKSWAIPKGPSLNPLDKRLAMMVEDHPVDYAHFEGVIPKGNYGAGTVMIWDEGFYQPVDVKHQAAGEEAMESGLQKGHLRFVLQGKKLKGQFSLVQLKRGDENAWLLVKKDDAFATTDDVLAQTRSAASGRTMEAIAIQSHAAETVWRSQSAKPELDLRDAPTAAMPHKVKPMLAVPAETSFDRRGWFFEIKWDGYRAIAEIEAGNVLLYSRQQRAFDKSYSSVLESLKLLGHDAVLDGEIVVLDDAGRPQFEWLQNYGRASPGLLVYYVFDLLYLDGHDLTGLPLRRRKELLASVLTDQQHVRISDHVEEFGQAFFAAVAERGLEGVMAKDAESPYRKGRRGPSWMKIKTQLRQRALICGFTRPRGTRTGFGALVLGIRKNDELSYIGSVGSGFSQKSLTEIRKRLEPLTQSRSPFKKTPKTDEPATWVRPVMECEITLAAWTESGHVRHPVFQRLVEVTSDVAVKVAATTGNAAPAYKPSLRPRLAKLNQKKLELLDGKRRLTLTNLNKLYWPDEAITKGDLIGYYHEIAEFILPYLQGRPQSLNRHPNGIQGKSFFQKDVSRQPPPEWIQTVDISSGPRQTPIRYLLCQEPAALLYLANLGCIELNPWHARIGTLDRPDYLVVDLDPEDIPFDRVVTVAQQVRKTLEQIGAASFCKTSGKRGLHVYVPLGARYEDEHVKQFAELVVRLIHRELPDLTSILRLPRQRQKRVYLDWLQNGQGKTLVAPYCARPNPGATVSTPLDWSEVGRGLDPSRFTIRTLPKRLAKVGDLWQSVLGPGIDLQACLAKMAPMLLQSGKAKL